MFYRVADPLVERLCRLGCDTVVEDLESEADARGELLRKLEQPRPRPGDAA